MLNVADQITEPYRAGRMNRETVLRILTCQRQTQLEAMNLWGALSGDVLPQVRAIESAIRKIEAETN